MEDVTARKRAEEELLNVPGPCRTRFSTARTSPHRHRRKGLIQIFNVGAERHHGLHGRRGDEQITPATLDPQEVIGAAKALRPSWGQRSRRLRALVFKASRGIEDIYELTYIPQGRQPLPGHRVGPALRDAPADHRLPADRHRQHRAQAVRPSSCCSTRPSATSSSTRAR